MTDILRRAEACPLRNTEDCRALVNPGDIGYICTRDLLGPDFSDMDCKAEIVEPGATQ